MMKKIFESELVYVVDCFPVTSETFVLNEIIEVEKRGIQVTVISLNKPSYIPGHPGAKLWAEKTIYLDQIDLEKKLRYSLLVLIFFAWPFSRTLNWAYKLGKPYPWITRHALTLAWIIHRTRCKHVHVHFAGPAAQYSVLAGLILSRPVSVTAHSYDIFETPPENLSGLAKKISFLITVSQYNQKYMEHSFNILAKKIKVLTCGVNTSIFFPREDKCKIPGQILTVARLSPEKALDQALQAAYQLKQSGVKFSWNIGGDGAIREQLENLKNSLGLNECVHFLGPLTQDQVIEELSKSEVFVLSSIRESAGMVYLEALSMKVPVVGTDVMGVSEIISNNIAGFLVPPKRPDLLAEKIALLLENPEIRIKMGQAGYSIISQKLNLSDQVSQLIAYWNELKPKSVKILQK